jgi:hypothetical protein
MPKSICSQSEIAQSVKYLTLEWMMGVPLKQCSTFIVFPMPLTLYSIDTNSIGK